jgi:predicted GIY-YIG superfamily endonuclease
MFLFMSDSSAAKFKYVYILRSKIDPDAHYTGCTEDLKARLAKHNEGGVPHTAKLKPWFIETAVSFRDSAKARAFEKYLKLGSGREFARRHF